MIDCHTHSLFSHDGRADPRAQERRAASLGLTYFAHTEHFDPDYAFGGLERFSRPLNLERYARFIKTGREKAPGNGGFIAYGLEIGYHPATAEDARRAADRLDLDVIVSSVHTLQGREAYIGTMFRGKTVPQVVDEYLNALFESVRVPYCDVVGHLGYVTRYIPVFTREKQFRLWHPTRCDRIDALLSEIIRLDRTLEINTHGGSGQDDFLPEFGILRRYRELGGDNITFSSDAHTVRDVGKGYQAARAAALRLGFTHWTVYKRRVPVSIQII